jgi:hypothetical protein
MLNVYDSVMPGGLFLAMNLRVARRLVSSSLSLAFSLGLASSLGLAIGAMIEIYEG